MELRQLKYFVTIVEQGSFSKAAEAVFVAQSALSHQIAKLEEELGTPLLHRMARGVALTEPGRAFLAYAVAILKHTADAKASVRGALDTPRGKVAVGLPPSVCSALAMPLFLAARRELPGVELELSEELTGSLAAQLRAGSVNVALLFDHGALSEFSHRPLVRERLYVISNASQPATTGRSIRFKSCLSLPLILASRAQGLRRIVEQAARENGLPEPNVVAEINSISIMRLALLAGVGHAILPRTSLKQELDSGMLRGAAIRGPELHRTVHACTSKAIPMSPATAAVHSLIVKVAHELCRTASWAATALT